MDKSIIHFFARKKSEQILNWASIEFGIHNIEVSVTLNFLKSGNSNVRCNINNFVMTLNLEKWVYLRKDIERVFEEYDSFSEDDSIGTFWGTWDQCLTALLCHEIAHIIEYYRIIKFLLKEDVVELYEGEFVNLKLSKNLFKNRRRHNRSWKEIYRILRNVFILHTKSVVKKSLTADQETFILSL